jgi:hypothetical protein
MRSVMPANVLRGPAGVNQRHDRVPRIAGDSATMRVRLFAPMPA